MGHTVGQVLREHGLSVFTCLQGRSQRTHRLAQAAGIQPLADVETLVQRVNILLSIVVPAQALENARRVAGALHATGADVLYVDCNAIAPQTAVGAAGLISDAGGRFVDGCIIGPPPHKPGETRFYISGSHANQALVLAEYGLDVRSLGEEVGRASALKMCYATSTKGFTALLAELMVAAEALGITDPLLDEFAISQPGLAQRIDGSLTRVPAKARRFVGEMQEISATFRALGLTPHILQGAAEMYERIGATPLADRNPEDPEMPTLQQVLAILVSNLTLERPSATDDDR